MRIRKRRPPPPPPSPPRHPSDLQSSTLQPPPSSSDSPPLNHDLLQPCDSPNQSLRSVTEDEDRPRPDLDLAAVSRTDGVDEKQNTHWNRRGANQDPPVGIGEEEDEVAAEENATVPTNRRIVYSRSVETSAGSCLSSSPSHQGHWCEEDKVFPLKKRRASFTSKVRERTIMDKEQKESVRGRRQINKNWVKDYYYYYYQGEGEEEDDAVEKQGAKERESGGKKIMEAWRCSRRNGRGWRCHRPTLLGYSMCEHHLSQARLRSLNSTVRSRSGPDIQRKKVYTSLYSEDDDDEKGLKKRKRIGILKARSISSLLGQTLPLPPPVML